MNRRGMGSGAWLVALALAPTAPAGAVEVRIEAGLRPEILALDDGFEFTCDCEPESDEDCAKVGDPDYCADANLDGPYDGVLYGALIGAAAHGGWWAVGGRLTGALGSFEPSDEAARRAAEDPSVLLTHVTFEVPIEINAGFGGAQGFLQVAPRFGVLNYSEDASEEDPDTFTAGVMVTAGLRFGGDIWKVGAEAGRVQHSKMSGWVVQATVVVNTVKAKPPVEDEALGQLAPAAAPAADEAAPAGDAAPEGDAPDAPDAPADPPAEPAAPEADPPA